MLLCVSSCGSCDKPEAPPVLVLTAEPPVAVPLNVIAEFTMSTPDETWKTLQTTLGGAAALAPPTIGGLMLASVGTDSSLPGLDTTQPVYGLFVGGIDTAEARRTVWCLHATPTGIASLRSALAESDTAKLKASGSEQSIEVLEPKSGSKPRFVGLAHGNFVIFAASREDIGNFGPYAYRTMPTKPVQKPAVVLTLSHGTLANLASGWVASHRTAFSKQLTDFDDDLRKDHGGRAPDFGDPKPLIDLFDVWGKSVGAALGDFDHAEADLDLDANGMHATLTLSPQKEGPARDLVASMRPGDAAPLLDAPAGLALSLIVRSDAAERLGNAVGAGETINAVTDKRISAADAKNVADALQTIAKTRGDYFLLSLSAVKTRGFAMTTRVSDDSKATRATGAIVELGVRPPFYDLLHAALGVKSQTSATIELPPLGKGRLFTLEREGSSGAVLGPTVQIAFASKDGVLATVLAPDAAAMLKLAAAPEHKCGDDPKLRAAVGKLGSDCTFAAILIPSALTSEGGSDGIVIGWGRRGDNAFASIDAGNVAARQVLQQASQGL